MTKSILDKSGLKYFWQKIKAVLDEKADKSDIPDISVKKDNETEYTLEISDQNGVIETPNLKGSSGVYVGSDEIMPTGYFVQIDPNGDIDESITKREFDNAIAMLKSQGVQQTPLFANGIEECTDTNKVYVLPNGFIYAYMKSTTERIVTEQIIGEIDDSRVSSGSTASASGYVTTPLIDLYAYPTPFVLHLDGIPYIPSTVENYSRYAIFDTEQNLIESQKTSTNLIKSNIGAASANAFENGESSIHFDTINDSLRYVRFSGVGTSEMSNIYITYTTYITAEQWTNTGIAFIGDGVSEEIKKKLSNLNNEGEAPYEIKLLPSAVLDFYNSDNYPDEDYSFSHLDKITYPYRADIPVPYTVRWNYNENAMRTTVAIDTKYINTDNKHSLITYDATGLNKYPIYNLIPNTLYYYKVSHVLPDGRVVTAKTGEFETSGETIRLINIDGTQNVRDLGGWVGLNGQKIRYGRLFRGASLSDSSYPELMITGKGKRAFGELGVQAELNLGAEDTETSIASNCSYKKIGYKSYAEAINSAEARTSFKEAIEYIVDCLKANKNTYFHCQGGCDRTGTLSFLLLGLLGVGESDLSKEYELSSFSSIGFGRHRNTVKEIDTYDYAGMVNALKTSADFNGETITERFYNFAVTACNIQEETIETFRALMLELR